MDLSTTYLGLHLPHPLMPGSSPLADDLDTVRRLEDAGAAAIVLRSLFEEQIVGEELATYDAHEVPNDSYADPGGSAARFSAASSTARWYSPRK